MNRINTNNFDFLRIVFASTVLFGHLFELSQVKQFQPFLPFFNTRLAISGFFVISGFLIAKSYEKTPSLKIYFLRRIKRIVPAYFTVILLCAVLLWPLSKLSFSGYFLDAQFWRYLAANLSFQNYIEPCLPNVFENNLICAVNGSLWTIKVEEGFYLSVPIFYWLIKAKKINFWMLSIATYVFAISYHNYFNSIDLYVIAKQLPGAMAFFIAGIVLFKKFEFFYKRKDVFIIPSLIAFFLEQYVLETHLLKPLSFAFMIFYLAYSIKYLNRFGKHGDFTYGIYILHFPLIQFFVDLNLFNSYNSVIVSIAVVTLTLFLSVVSWNYIELPFLSNDRKARHKKLLSINKK